MDESLFSVEGEKNSVEQERGEETERERKSECESSLRALNTCYLTQEVVLLVPRVFLRVLVVVC